MRNRILQVFLLLLIAGGFSAARAQGVDSSTTRIKTSKDITPSWTYKGQWTGFLTCNRLQRQGNRVTPDDVKKCIAEGGNYILSTGNRFDLQPAAKLEPFAGQQVYIVGTITSKTYGTGPTSDASIEGLYAGGDRPATRFEMITVLSLKALPKAAPTKLDDDFSSRVSDKAQK